MRRLRIAAAVLVVILAAVAVHRFVWLPYQCNAIRLTLRNELATLFSVASRTESPRAKLLARRAAATAEECARRCPTNPDFLMMAGVSHVIMENPGAAVERYEAALRIDRRPEIYLGLGMALLQSGRREEAVEVLTTASTFAPYTIQQIADPMTREEVAAAVAERDRRITGGAAAER